MTRLIILHSVLLGLCIAAWFLGYVQVLWDADHFLAIPIVGSLTVVGLGLLATGHRTDSLWLADKLPVVGLALTVIGLLWASNGDLEGLQFKRDIIHALVGNLMGVVGFAWLELNAKVCR